MLFKFKKETLQHLLFSCPERVHAFWDEVFVMLNPQGITFKSLDTKDIVFGAFDAPYHVNDRILPNYTVLESKYFIYRTKLKKTSLSFKLLFARIKITFQIKRIARKKNYINTRCLFLICFFVFHFFPFLFFL